MSKSSNELKNFFGKGLFDWQKSGGNFQQQWDERKYDPEKYWGGFSSVMKPKAPLPQWAIGPFEKFEGNPIYAPDEKCWDNGHFGGGVHNGAVIERDGKFYYIYRGETPADTVVRSEYEIGYFDYMCDIGLAVSDDGICFKRLLSERGIFRVGDRKKYSYEDVCCVKDNGRYHLFCNQWNWLQPLNSHESGVFHAVSDNLIDWQPIGMVFENAVEIHRNACVLQNTNNEAVKVNGKYVMYLNNGYIAYSEDLNVWISQKTENLWPGGEGCFALADYNKQSPDDVLLFTGGHHSGHFYAIGEVLFSKINLGKAKEWLERPVLTANENIAYESGYSAKQPYEPISHWRDTVFFTGLSCHDGKYFIYYGGSEYFTCLATAPVLKL